MALVRKNTSPNKSNEPKQQIIKINPYEIADNVMELMASICAATPTADTNLFWNVIREAYQGEGKNVSLKKYLEDNRNSLFNKDFAHDLNEYCKELSWNISAHENTEHTQIVVAGGFSAGKSSFLNRLTNSANLLPTGVEPVSVVKTYLYCSPKYNSVSVQGVNQKDVLVNLSPGVLQAIQHSKNSNVYLASVLEKLFVKIPSSRLDGLVFIDTPGYNNSDKANQSNGKTDKDTAIDALREGNVLFWLIDCERGTTVTADIDIIKEFGSKKKVFIFNKADKKGPEESRRIVEDAARVLGKEFPKDEIIDILAYSTLEDKVFHSQNGYSLDTIISKVKAEGNGQDGTRLFYDAIEQLFDDEITSCEITIDGLVEDHNKAVEKKKDRQSSYYAIKNNDEEYITSEVRQVLVNEYNELKRDADNISDAAISIRDSYSEFWDAVQHWDAVDHECWTNTLTPILDKYANQYNSTNKRLLESLDYTYFVEEYRKDLAKRVHDYITGIFKDLFDDACFECDTLINQKSSEEQLKKDMIEYKNFFMSALNQGISQFKKCQNATNVNDKDQDTLNVFETIKKNDYKQFLRSFESGVDISLSNAEGYNPMTLAVQMGNNMMVQFLLSQNVDPSIKDRRGYNAFHTAVENQYRDICKMLLDVDPDLLDSKTDKGESVDELARKQTFNKWLETEINNAC